MTVKKVSLCISNTCPYVEVNDDYVIIGEEPENYVILKHKEFEVLRVLFEHKEI